MDIRKFFVAAAAVAAAAMPAPALAAQTASATGRALILLPLTITKVNDLDFGTVVSSSSSGTVSIAADGSGQSVTGGVTPVASGTATRAVFAGGGTAGSRSTSSSRLPPTSATETATRFRSR